MNKHRLDIIDIRLIYWDSFRNRWYGKQLGDCCEEKDENGNKLSPHEYILKVSKATRWRFAHNKWDSNKQEEMTTIWFQDNYRWISCNDGAYDTVLKDNEEYNKECTEDENKSLNKPVHPNKWHQFGGPLDRLNKKHLYTMAFGGKPKWEMDEWGEKSPGSTDHYDWYPPREVQWRGG